MKVLLFGEILLRLASPGYTKLFQKESLEATFCGSEANVAVSLSNFGLNSIFLTKVPNNDIGRAAEKALRYFGVDTSKIIYGNGRMGLYYLEKGASQRASKVIYDRYDSAISLAGANEFIWNEIFDDVDWFHWTGITPALSKNLENICLEACRIAKKKEVIVSCDLNYRKKLWDSEKSQRIMSKLMPYVDVCIANEEDADQVLNLRPDNNNVSEGKLNKEGYEWVAKEICRKYHCKYVAFTFRESYSASVNGWSGMLYDNKEKKAYFSRKYDIQIIDRVGGGDSFSAGIIYGLILKKKNQEIIEFATAASCLKHTIEGDFNRVTVKEVEDLLCYGGNGRVQR